MKAQDGTLLMNTEENINRWAEYYRDLLNKAIQHIDGRNEPLTEGPLHQVTCGRQTAEKMKNGKSCRPDGIPTEALKHLGDWGGVKPPKSPMRSCKAARWQTNGEREPSHLSIKARETT